MSRDAIYGHLVGVTWDRYGATLAGDVALGDTTVSVDDVGDFAEGGGHVLIGGVPHEHGPIADEDATTLTLLHPATAAASAEDTVHRYSQVMSGPVQELVALVSIDDSEDGDPLRATVLQSLTNRLASTRNVRAGLPVDLEITDLGELMLVDLPGADVPSLNELHASFDDPHQIAVAGDQQVTLDHIPYEDSLHMRWGASSLTPGVEWTRDGLVVTIPDPRHRFKVTDPPRELSAQYLWCEGDQLPMPGDPIVVDVQMTQATLQTHSGDPVTLNFPGDEAVFPIGPAESAFLYGVQWGGFDEGTTDWVPATPDGYTLTDVRPIIRAFVEAAQTDIPDDTSGWGFAPPPAHYPFLAANTSNGLCFDTFPVGAYPEAPIVCGAPDSIPNITVDGLPAHGWHLVQRDTPIHLNYMALRFTFTPNGG